MLTIVPKWHLSRCIFVNGNIHKGSSLANRNGVEKPKGRGEMFLMIYSSILVIVGGVSVVVT